MKEVIPALANTLHSFVIGPEGELYKCWNDVGLKTMIIGDIRDGRINHKNHKIEAKYITGVSPFNIPSCKECFLLPQCMGRCPYKRIQKHIEGIDVDYCSHFKGNVRKFIALHYKQKIKD